MNNKVNEGIQNSRKWDSKVLLKFNFSELELP